MVWRDVRRADGTIYNSKDASQNDVVHASVVVQGLRSTMPSASPISLGSIIKGGKLNIPKESRSLGSIPEA